MTLATSGDAKRVAFCGMDELDARVRAICDLNVAEVREYAGRHEYDGVPQDLSAAGVAAGLSRLARAREAGAAQPDPHDEAHLRAFEDLQWVVYRDLELHRRNPLLHLGELDLACYDKEYAPPQQRAAARLAHLAGWPQAVDNAIAALDQVSGPVAAALLRAARGLAMGIPGDADEQARAAALAAHGRLVSHLELAAAQDRGDTALGAAGLSALMGSAEGLTLDLGMLADQADAERDRLTERLAESCARIDPGRPPLEVARELVRDHPDGARVIDAARQWTERAIEFTRDRDLMPYHDGECLVGLAPPSRRWAMAMMCSNAPGEPDGPSWYHITPPEESWPPREIEEWLEVFSDTTLPGITVHEAAAGPSAAPPPWSGGYFTRPRSSRGGRTMPRNCASRRGSARPTRGSRSGYGWRPSSGLPGWPAPSACIPRA